MKKIKNLFNYYKRHGLWRLIESRVLDRVVSFYWRYKYKYSLRRLWINKKKIKIERPIFVLGVEGAGLSLLSRMLFHHPDVVYPEGNSDHWGGHDQMDGISIFNLPEELSLRNPASTNHPIFGRVRTRIYATDTLVGEHRKTEKDVTPELRYKFQSVIKRIIMTYAHNPYNARFATKPQSYTLKVPFILELLKGIDVKFVLVMKNPYALSWSYVVRDPESMYKHYNKKLTDEEKIKLGAQHWKNSYQIALNDLKQYGSYHVVRFEDILHDLKSEVKKVFDYCELEFHEDFLPQAHHKLHLGITDRYKWYPVKRDVNEKYLSSIPRWAIEIVDEECGELAKKFNYTPEGP